MIVPLSVKFLLGFANDLMVPSITASSYISFVGGLTLVFGLVFELPIVSLFLTKVGLISPNFLTARRKQAIVVIFIAAALITPPDVVTQCMMAVPLIVLFELGIWFSRMAYRAG